MCHVSKEPQNDPGQAMDFERKIEALEAKIAELEEISLSSHFDLSEELEALKAKRLEELDKTYADLSAWERVGVARHPNRPVASDYIQGMGKVSEGDKQRVLILLDIDKVLPANTSMGVHGGQDDQLVDETREAA